MLPDAHLKMSILESQIDLSLLYTCLWTCIKFMETARPGLAQLVQFLTQRYSESTSPLLATVCVDRTGSCAGCQDIGRCSTRSGSQGMYIMFASAMQIRQPSLTLKPRGDVTRNPKQGYQWPQNRTHVSAKNFLKKVHGNLSALKPENCSAEGTGVQSQIT